jgi:hypothetical protein
MYSYIFRFIALKSLVAEASQLSRTAKAFIEACTSSSMAVLRSLPFIRCRNGSDPPAQADPTPSVPVAAAAAGTNVSRAAPAKEKNAAKGPDDTGAKASAAASAARPIPKCVHVRSLGPRDARSLGPRDARSLGPRDARSLGPRDARSLGPRDARSLGPRDARFPCKRFHCELAHATDRENLMSAGPTDPTPRPLRARPRASSSVCLAKPAVLSVVSCS